MRYASFCRKPVPRLWLSLTLALLINASVIPTLIFSNLLFPSNDFVSSFHIAYADDEPIFSDDQCFAVADEPSKLDALIEIDLTEGTTTKIGDIQITGQMEAIAVVPDPVIAGQATIYAANAHIFGSLSVQGYGSDEPVVYWVPIGPFGRANGSADSVTLSDVDGLTFDIKNDIMYGVQRRNQNKPDLLFVVDRYTGHFIPGYFDTPDGPADYVEIDIIDGLHDVDDIAIHPETREMYGIINDNGRGGILVQLDPATGAITKSYTIRDGSGQVVDDLEGLAFTSSFELYGSTGEHGPDRADKNKLFWINLNSRDEINQEVRAYTTAVFEKNADDVEGLGCLTTPPGTPAIEIEKSTNGQDADEPGSGPEIFMGCPVVWDYTITNIGEVDLSNVQLQDDQLGQINCPSAELVEGESMVCSIESTATAIDYANLGSVTADSSRGPVSATDPSHYTGIPTSIVLEKYTNGHDADVAPGPTIPQGEAVTWTYVVTNTSTVPLQGITVTDDQLADGEISCPAAQLAAGASMTCSASGVAVAGQYANIGTVTATPEGGCIPVTDSDPSHYFGAVPGMILEKFTNGFDADLPEDGPELAVGCEVLWSYEISNTGNIALENLILTDDQIGPISCPAEGLPVGESMVCSSPGFAVEGQYANIGTVTATPVGSTIPLDATDPSHYSGLLAAVEIEKSTSSADVEAVDADEAPGPSIQSGTVVTWTYSVVNTGALDLINVTVVDDQVADVQCPQDTLAIGESMICTASGTAISGQYANIATVIANAVTTAGVNACSPVTDSDPSHYFGILPDLDIAQTVVVDWSYSVTNTGQITLENVLVDGGADVEISCPLETLDIGQSMSCTASGPQERFSNDAIVTAYPQGRDIELVQQISATPITSLELSVLADGAQSGGGFTGFTSMATESVLAVGSETTWRYLLENNSTFAVERIDGQVIDLLSGEAAVLTCPQSTLAPASTMECTLTHTVAAGRNGRIGSVVGYLAGTDRLVASDAVAFYHGVAPATVGGRLFVDELSVVGTANGLQDPGEKNLLDPNVEVKIELYRYDGSLVQTGGADDEGRYEFTGLLPDDYYIVVHRPTATDGIIQGFLWSQPNQTNNRLDSDVDAAWNVDPDLAQTEFFRLESGEVDYSWDIGFQQLSLFGQVYVDANENGQRDDGEEGLSNVTVSLSNESLSGAEVITLNTDGSGIYDYGTLDPSRYVIHITPPSQYRETLSGTAGEIDLANGVNFALVPDTSTTIYLPLLTGLVTEGGK